MYNLNIPVAQAELSNGLRIVHSYDGTTAMAAVNILYNVGSRDERRDLTGMAHLFEHLMFGGSVNVPNFDTVLTRAGGSNNAWTSTDFTNFYETIPAQNIDTAFYLESDRMLQLAFNQRSLDVQKGVVIEEFKQRSIDAPFGDLMHHLRALLYSPTHPYSWPTIGLVPEHIAKVTMQEVKEWFYSHYAPNNAILSVSGNVDFDKTIALAEKWFGDIPRREIKPRILPDPGFPTEKAYKRIEGNVPVPLMVLAFPMSAYGTQAYFAADAITDLLSQGQAARFPTDIVFNRGRGLITDCDASIIGSEHEGLILVMAYLAKNTPQAFDDAEKLIIDEMRKLSVPGNISHEELERCFNRFEAEFRFGNIGYLARATRLATATYHGEDINSTVADRRALTAADIAAEADRLFNINPYARLDYAIAQN